MPPRKQTSLDQPPMSHEEIKQYYREKLDALRAAAAEAPLRDDDQISAGNPLWEMIVSAGVSASEDDNEKRWFLGTLGGMVETTYGKRNFASWVESINQHYRTMAEYRQVTRFYDEQSRIAFSDLNSGIMYTHFRTAMKLGRNWEKHGEGRAVESAWDFLEQCADHHWSPDKAELEAQDRMPKEGDDALKEEKDGLTLTGVILAVERSAEGTVRLLFEVSDSPDVIDPLYRALIARELRGGKFGLQINLNSEGLP